MIYAHLATIESREDNAIQVVNDILPQVDKMYVYFSKGYGAIPLWVNTILGNESKSRIVPILPKEDKGDAGKFSHHHETGYHVTVDDDLFYPPDFVEVLKRGCDRHGKPVSLHGRSFNRKVIKSYYLDHVKHYKVTGAVPLDADVQFPGTGCFMYHTKQVRFDLRDFPKPNMADIWVGKKLKDIGVVCLSHPANWVRMQKVDDEGIYGDFRDWGDEYQTQIVNEYLAV